MDAGYKPDGHNAVSPYVLVKDVRAVFDFLAHAFGAAELRRQVDADGAIRHAHVRIGDSVPMVGFRPWDECRYQRCMCMSRMSTRSMHGRWTGARSAVRGPLGGRAG
jgi:uncharacterized glyoxalase superfamily protein PhnB